MIMKIVMIIVMMEAIWGLSIFMLTGLGRCTFRAFPCGYIEVYGKENGIVAQSQAMWLIQTVD